jgi:hypothetical protein
LINGLFAPWRRCSRFLRLEICSYILRLKKRSRLASEQKSSLISASLKCHSSPYYRFLPACQISMAAYITISNWSALIWNWNNGKKGYESKGSGESL